MNTIRILVIDEHAVVRAGLRALTAAEPGLEVVEETGDALTAIADGCSPDVAVVGEVSGAGLGADEVIARLRETHPSLRVLALAAGKDQFRSRLAAGATGFVLKQAALTELAQAIRTVAAGETYLDPSLTDAPPALIPDAVELSEREAEVLRLIALGYSNKQIAAQLAVSIKTVETYKSRSMEKLGARDRVAIVRYAAKRGWLSNA